MCCNRQAARAEARVKRDEDGLDAARENLADEIEMAEMLGDEAGMEAEIKHTRRQVRAVRALPLGLACVFLLWQALTR